MNKDKKQPVIHIGGAGLRHFQDAKVSMDKVALAFTPGGVGLVDSRAELRACYALGAHDVRPRQPEHQPHLTNAQFRFLKRAIAGERLPLYRFKGTAPTVAALVRKGCLSAYRDDRATVAPFLKWIPTEHAKRVAAAHGKSPHRED